MTFTMILIVVISVFNSPGVIADLFTKHLLYEALSMVAHFLFLFPLIWLLSFTYSRNSIITKLLNPTTEGETKA